MTRILKLVVILCICSTSFAQKGVSKINGISFVSNRSSVDISHINPVKKVQANYAAVMPFGFISLENPSEVRYNHNRQWYGETKEGGRNYIGKLHTNNIQVMLKPHIWIRHGQYTGHLTMQTEEAWKQLEDSYRGFILDYAKLAQEEQVAIFSIGVELEQFVANRPQYWKDLIKEIRAIYKGKLTYSSNWDEYSRVPFWDQLDFIGIDSYFPVSESQTPTVQEVQDGLQRWKGEMNAFSQVHKKQILFTEWGYRSIDFAGKEPWATSREEGKVNLEAQANATKAVFETFWKEDWFAGGFVWKWFIHHDQVGGPENNRFTPQNKPAEAVIQSYYEKY